MIAYFARNRILTNLLFLIILVAGFSALRQLPVEAFPDMSFGTVVVITPWPGALPEDIENQITIPIEEKVSEVDYIYRLSSVSEPGRSKVEIKFDESLNDLEYQRLLTDVQSKLREVQRLPQDSEPPIAMLVNSQDWKPLVKIALSGPVDELILKQQAEWIKMQLINIPGINKIQIVGDRQEEFHVLYDSNRLLNFGLTPEDLIEAIGRHNQNIAAGTISHETGAFLVRSRLKPESIAEIAKIPIKPGGVGQLITIGDVAEVVQGFQISGTFQKQGGELALMLQIFRQKGENSLNLIPLIQSEVNKLTPRLNRDLRITWFEDSAQEIRRNISVLLQNLGQGTVLVFLILLVFLGAKNSILAIIGIPVGFMTGIVFLKLFGYSINSISIFSMVIVSGMVVDDAIVILENISTHYQRGKNLMDAAIDGTNEVFWPVVASAMTTLAAFMPMVIMTGEIGRVMVVIPITVSLILVASLLEAFLMLPCHFVDVHDLARYFTNSKAKDFNPAAARFWNNIQRRTDSIVGFLLKNPGRNSLICTFVLLLLSGLAYQSGRVRLIMFPSDARDFLVTVDYARNLRAEEVSQKITELERNLWGKLQGKIANLTTSIGQKIDEDYSAIRAEHVAQIRVSLNETLSEDLSLFSVMQEVQAYLNSNSYPEVTKISVRQVPDGPRLGKPVAVRIQHKNQSDLLQMSDKIRDLLQSTDGLASVESNLIPAKDQLDLKIDETRAAYYGLSTRSVAIQVAAQTDGIVIARISAAAEDTDLRLRCASQTGMDLNSLLQLPVITPDLRTVPLSELCEIKITPGFAGLHRHQQNKSITLGAALASGTRRTATEINLELRPKVEEILNQFPGSAYSLGGEFEESQKSLGSLQDAFVIAAILMFLILATQFQSLIQPFLILLIIPYSCLGVVIGMGIWDQPFTMLAFIAMVGLAGIVVNGNIVLVDLINRNSMTMSYLEAVRLAPSQRVRALVLTTATTVFGLMPTVFGWGGNSIIWRPMAIALCFGVVTSMFITIFIMPCLMATLGNEKGPHETQGP